MRKSKVLSVAMSAVLAASLAAATSVSASAIAKSSEIPDHQVGVVGSFNGWDNDVILTDADGDGVYEGTVEVDNVTEEMIVGWNVDDQPTGESYLQFKVRLDGKWGDSWGNYEPENDRVWNSQSNVPVKEAVVGQPITFTVYFDIKNPAPAALSNPDSYAEEGSDDFNYLNVYYKVVDTTPDPSSEPEPDPETDPDPDPSVVSTTGGDSSTPTSTVASETSVDSSAPATGDATSAAALAAVVVASLGIAVVMTKKASAK